MEDKSVWVDTKWGFDGFCASMQTVFGVLLAWASVPPDHGEWLAARDDIKDQIMPSVHRGARLRPRGYVGVWVERIRADGDVGRFFTTFEEVWDPKWPPPEQMEHFSEMSLLFDHAKFGEAYLSSHMREFVPLSSMSVSTHWSQQGRVYAPRLRALTTVTWERVGCFQCYQYISVLENTNIQRVCYPGDWISATGWYWPLTSIACEYGQTVCELCSWQNNHQ